MRKNCLSIRRVAAQKRQDSLIQVKARLAAGGYRASMNERPLMNSRTVTVDVREDIRRGREPLSRIMDAAAVLQAGECLLVIAPFEPVPLFHAMEKQGFGHTARSNKAGDWEVLFARQANAQPAEAAPTTACNGAFAPAPAEIVEVDARGLEPPQPLVKILESLAILPAGAELRACTDRRPMHLYAQIEERGFAATTEEQSNGSFLTHIRRR
jgi:uncharacterized protein (DUF2249 family)